MHFHWIIIIFVVLVALKGLILLNISCYDDWLGGFICMSYPCIA